VSRAGLTQLRIAETEKYPHVTFFFNGGEEKVYDGEDRILIPSPKVATYDMQPEMSASMVTDKIVEAIEQDKFDFIVVNYANPDMVGHTGVIAAAIKAMEALDVQLQRLLEVVKKKNGAILVTADHGNCEMMYDPETKQPHTAHTLNKVPVVLVSTPKAKSLHDGKLADLAPTLLELMALPKPALMDGESLIVLKR
jgi:2,3-bisphosphoglycerate-independent phosphoglycerate mutase